MVLWVFGATINFCPYQTVLPGLTQMSRRAVTSLLLRMPSVTLGAGTVIIDSYCKRLVVAIL